MSKPKDELISTLVSSVVNNINEMLTLIDNSNDKILFLKELQFEINNEKKCIELHKKDEPFPKKLKKQSTLQKFQPLEQTRVSISEPLSKGKILDFKCFNI